MRRLNVLWGSFLVGLLLALSMGMTAVAQEASPTPDTPDADECVFEPRTVEEMQALHGTPAPEGAGEATSAVEATPVDYVHDGEPADEETVAEITIAIRGLTACYNAGHYLAAFGGVTDEFILSQVGLSLFDEDFVTSMNAEPVPLDEGAQTEHLDVREVRVLDDGRVAALFDYVGVHPQVEGIDGVETDVFIFENVDGEWLLDESIENVEGTHGPEGIATPDA